MVTAGAPGGGTIRNVGCSGPRTVLDRIAAVSRSAGCHSNRARSAGVANHSYANTVLGPTILYSKPSVVSSRGFREDVRLARRGHARRTRLS